MATDNESTSKEQVWSDGRIMDELGDYDPGLSRLHVSTLFRNALALIERLQKDNADLRHDIERAVKANSYSADEPPVNDPAACSHQFARQCVKCHKQLDEMPTQPPEALRCPTTHEAADAFWKSWRENGETHKHGYYESTWKAVNAALRTRLTKCPECGGYGIVRHPGGRSEPYPCPSCTPAPPAVSSSQGEGNDAA